MELLGGGVSFDAAMLVGWHISRDGNSITLGTPAADGSLTVSGSRTVHALAIGDLEYLARDHIADGHKPRRIELGDFIGVAFEYVEESTLYRHWYLSAGAVLLQANFECSARHRDIDRCVDSVLASLRVNENAL